MGEYERFLADPAFAKAFSSAYRGRHAPADALWWFEHPDRPSATGAEPPDARLRETRMRAFSRSGNAAAVAALGRLEGELAADRSATVSALSAARPAVAGWKASEVVAVGASAKPSAHTTPRVFRSSAVGAVILALVAGLLIGRGASPTPALSGGGSPPMLAIFSQPRVESDSPRDLDFGLALDPSTFHRLSDSPVSPAGAVQLVYAVRDLAGSPCLVMIAGAPRATTVDCVPERQITVAGISVYLRSGSIAYAAAWSADGSVTVSSDPLPSQD